MKFSIVIPTYNRANDLRDTLSSLANLPSTTPWEAIIVDNNSSDNTRQVIEEAGKTFPVTLKYVFEPEQGRSAALNAGLEHSRGEVIANTDDDVQVEVDWLDRIQSALDRFDCDYVGGKVLPMWSGSRPSWLPERRGKHWGVLAIMDHGNEPFEFTPSTRPYGVNIAFRRSAFDRVGLWNNSVGRKAGTLLGQEVREWVVRARAAGLRGFYIPEMIVHHRIPQERLNKKYFHQWMYWHGISRALLYNEMKVDMESPDDVVLDTSKVRHIFGVPFYMYRKFLRQLIKTGTLRFHRDPSAAFDHEMWLWFFAGICRQRWMDRKHSFAINTKLPEMKP